jgi:hypothetical protein
MSEPGEDAPVSSELVRSYVITGGRRLPSDKDLSLHTLVTLAPDRQPPLGAGPETRAIWELCSGGYLAVVEVAAHLGLPVGVARMLLTDLAERGHLLRRAAPPRAKLQERAVIEKVLHGLRKAL